MPASLEPGARRYRIESLLSKGSSGRIYRAVLEEADGREIDVAIKLLADADVESLTLARLREETRLIGQVQDRAIVSIDEPIRLGDRWALVMDLVTGASLQRLTSLGAMPIPVVAEIVGEVARVLDKVWSAPGPEGKPLRILHRDIKPSNLQLNTAGELRILDFGVAKADFRNRDTQTAAYATGTRAFIAPERLEGNDTLAGDIYSLGVTAHVLLGDERAPSADDPDTAIADRATQAMIALVSRMRSENPSARPSASEVERLCGRIRQSAEGVTLREWAERNVPRAIAVRFSDAVVGTVLMEGGSAPRASRRPSTAPSQAPASDRSASRAPAVDRSASRAPASDRSASRSVAPERASRSVPPSRAPATSERASRSGPPSRPPASGSRGTPSTAPGAPDRASRGAPSLSPEARASRGSPSLSPEARSGRSAPSLSPESRASSVPASRQTTTPAARRLDESGSLKPLGDEPTRIPPKSKPLGDEPTRVPPKSKPLGDEPTRIPPKSEPLGDEPTRIVGPESDEAEQLAEGVSGAFRAAPKRRSPAKPDRSGRSLPPTFEPAPLFPGKKKDDEETIIASKNLYMDRVEGFEGGKVGPGAVPTAPVAPPRRPPSMGPTVEADPPSRAPRRTWVLPVFATGMLGATGLAGASALLLVIWWMWPSPAELDLPGARAPSQRPRPEVAGVELALGDDSLLPPPTGLRLTFSSIPLGADVYIDHKPVGQTPVIGVKVSEGVHEVIFVSDFARIVTNIEAGEKKPVRYVWKGGDQLEQHFGR